MEKIEQKRQQNIKNVGTFKKKNKLIRQALKKDFSNDIFKLDYYGEEKSFLIGEKVPLLSFSSLTRGLNMSRFENIPKDKLNIVALKGKKVMENMETYFNYGTFLHEEQDIIKINLIINEWLLFNHLELKAVEKVFISPCKKYYGYIDCIAWDKLRQEFILIEIKTRGKNYRGIDNITKAQTQFYKENFYNIKSVVLSINRDYDFTKKQELKSNWKIEEVYIKGCTNYTRIIKLYNDFENWDKFNYISEKKV